VLVNTAPAFGEEAAAAAFLPSPSCAENWVMEGKVERFNRDNLFERINGEAELYMPYGFQQLEYGRYASIKDPQSAIEADIYTMGSLRDAFGMYANYRRKDDPDASVGAEGSLSASQLFFYQDRYLVRLQATGSGNPPPAVFQACARAIAKNLPAESGRPGELAAFDVPGLVPKSQRYIAASLLGYDFFPTGFMADVTIKGQEVQIFLVPSESRGAARAAFEAYRSALAAGGKVTPAGQPNRTALSAVDPMYGAVAVELTGRFVIGVVRYADFADAQRLLDQVRKRVEAL